MVRPVRNQKHLAFFQWGPGGQKIKHSRSLGGSELVSRFPGIPANRLSIKVALNPKKVPGKDPFKLSRQLGQQGDAGW